MNNDNVENTENAAEDAVVNTEAVAPIDYPTTTEPEIVEQAAPVTDPEPVAAVEPIAVTPNKAGRQPSLLGAAVSGNAVDQVLLSSCVFKNKFARKSLSIHHVQRRLSELGYPDAASDKDGWYGDLTASAVAVFQATEGLEATGALDMATLNAIFHDDPNVTVGA